MAGNSSGSCGTGAGCDCGMLLLLWSRGSLLRRRLRPRSSSLRLHFDLGRVSQLLEMAFIPALIEHAAAAAHAHTDVISLVSTSAAARRRLRSSRSSFSTK